MANIYDFSAQKNDGQTLNFKDLKGKVILIVNTASKCGFTPQYTGLEALNRKYNYKGLVVLGFPCNQFANQEPGSDSEITIFCQMNYGVTFQLMKKIDVNGETAIPLYKYLKDAAGGFMSNEIKWNFTKFLVSRDGNTIKRYSPATKPEKLEDDIVSMLAQ